MLSIIKWFSRQLSGKIHLKLSLQQVSVVVLCLQRQTSELSEIPLNSFFPLSLQKEVLRKFERCLLETQTKINQEVLKYLIVNCLYHLWPDLDLHSLCAFVIRDDGFPSLPPAAVFLVEHNLGGVEFIQECDWGGGKIKACRSFGAAWFSEICLLVEEPSALRTVSSQDWLCFSSGAWGWSKCLCTRTKVLAEHVVLYCW